MRTSVISALLVVSASCGRIDFVPRDDSNPGDADASADAAPSCGQLFCADPSFDGDGVVAIDVASSDNTTFATRGIAERADGRLVVVGKADQAGGGTDMLVVGLLATGARDPSFGSGGVEAFGPMNAASAATGVAVRADDRIIVVGGSDGAAVIARRLAGGGPDNTFAIGGSVTFSLGDMMSTTFNGAVLYPDDRIVAGGQTSVPEFDIALARVQGSGMIDPSLGGSGDIRHDIAGDEFGTLAAAGPNNTLYVVGQSFGSTDFDCMVLRLLADGSLDPSFAGDGSALTALAGEDRCFDLVRDASDRLVVAGFTRGATDEAFLVFRLLGNGAIDPTFGAAGYTRVDAGALEVGAAVTVLPDGRIVTGGRLQATGSDSAMLLLLSPEGALLGMQDLGFAQPSRVRSLRIDQQGRLLVMGDIAGEGTDIVVARYFVP